MRILRQPVVAAAAACVLVATTVRPATAATTLGWYDVNSNGRADTWLVDDNGDGVTDRMIVDGNENNYGEAQVFYQGGLMTWASLDANEDGQTEMAMQPVYWSNGTLRGRTMWSDQDRNGRWENGYYDANLDGIYEWVCVDTNYDGLADTWTGTSAPAGGGAIANMMARNVAFRSWVDGMHGRGLSVFFPPVSMPIP